jgi:uncharacterized membrane protein
MQRTTGFYLGVLFGILGIAIGIYAAWRGLTSAPYTARDLGVFCGCVAAIVGISCGCLGAAAGHYAKRDGAMR